MNVFLLPLLLLACACLTSSAQESTREGITRIIDLWWQMIQKTQGEVHRLHLASWYLRYADFGDDMDTGVFEDGFCDLFDQGDTSFRSDFNIDMDTCRAYFRTQDLYAIDDDAGEFMMRVNNYDVEEIFDFCDEDDGIGIISMNETVFKNCFTKMLEGVPISLEYTKRARLTAGGDYLDEWMDKRMWDTLFPSMANGSSSVDQTIMRDFWTTRANHGPTNDADAFFKVMSEFPRLEGNPVYTTVTVASQDAMWNHLEVDDDPDGFLSFQEYMMLAEYFRAFLSGRDPYPPPPTTPAPTTPAPTTAAPTTAIPTPTVAAN